MLLITCYSSDLVTRLSLQTTSKRIILFALAKFHGTWNFRQLCRVPLVPSKHPLESSPFDTFEFDKQRQHVNLDHIKTMLAILVQDHLRRDHHKRSEPLCRQLCCSEYSSPLPEEIPPQSQDEDLYLTPSNYHNQLCQKLSPPKPAKLHQLHHIG